MIVRPGRGVALAAAAGLVLVTLAGCSSDGTGASAESPTGAASALPAGCALTVTDQWVKAADSGMTAVFGTISNPAEQQVVVVSAASPAAGKVEIHEVVVQDGGSVMQPKPGGLVIPAGGSATLAPGGDHLMLMDLTGPIEPGQDVEVTLECESGATTEFVAVAKPFEGGGETYAPNADGMDTGGASPSASEG